MIEVIDLGVCDYPKAHAIQKKWVEDKKADSSLKDIILLVEHPAVYTVGRGGTVETAYVPIVPVERGGQATYHNEGQLVAYPILTLLGGNRDLHKYLRELEAIILATLQHFAIEGERNPGATGVWVRGSGEGENGLKKIASIGVAVSGWVTYHGIALNVSNELEGFSRIQPCGFSSDVMTSMRSILGERCPGMSEVKRVFTEAFLRRFGKRSES